VLTTCESIARLAFECGCAWFDRSGSSSLAKSGVLTTLRFLFAELRVTECYGDITPITMLICKLERAKRG